MDIKLDEKGIFIDGSYRVLLASSLFYFRIPRERWKERMMLLQAAGYNTIDVYFPWNYHETEPGIWDFEGNRDVDAFLKLAEESGLFVIARPGPYICSEWDGGAIPAWLWEQNIAVRQDNIAFLKAIGNWYGHILPVLAEHQITKGGSVICMQIENELDFFDCKSPVSYMEKLKTKANEMGMEVPLFYCCGQNDLLRAGGLTPYLHTAFNVYADAENEMLEERALYLYRAARERKMPFLVTETNREHSFLKRLLACGAKLLSPYNQTAGSTMDWYNGITNWGTQEEPLSLLASDYDFHSMIGAAGEANEQFFEARLLAGMLSGFGERLAKAAPVKAQQVSLISEHSCNRVIPFLDLGCGGFLEVSNLGPAGKVVLKRPDSTMKLEMETLETRLLPCGLRLTDNSDCEIGLCNYEIGWIQEAAGRTEVCLYGSGYFFLSVQNRGENKTVTFDRVEGIQKVEAFGVLFHIGSRRDCGMACIPGLPDLEAEPGRQEQRKEAAFLMKSDLTLCCDAKAPVSIAPMETLGQYRGIGRYEVQIEEAGTYLLAKAADMITLQKDGVVKEFFFAYGNCRERYLEEGRWEVDTEIWGHSNFDDIRLPSLKMNSQKGIEKLVLIKRRENISESWLFDLDEAPVESHYFFRPSPYQAIMGIDGYNRAVSPLRTVYDRYVTLDPALDTWYLHFEKAECMIWVYVNGTFVEMVQKADPYVDISRFADGKRLEITLRLLRRYWTDPVGEVTLLGGRCIKSCCFGKVDLNQAKSGTETKITLPCAFLPGENVKLRLTEIPEGADDLKLFFKGRDLKLTVFAGGHTAGRILLDCAKMPAVAGGDPNVVTLCREWLDREDFWIWCQAAGPDPVLEKVEIRQFAPLSLVR